MTTNTINLAVSEYLEQIATDEQKKKGLDLANYRLEQRNDQELIHDEPLLSTQPLIVQILANWQANLGGVLRPDMTQIEYL